MGNGMEGYRRALDGFDDVLRAVPDDRWASASPCSEWTARDVAGHVITNQRGVPSMVGMGPAPERTRPPGAALGEDPVADWTEAQAAVRRVLDDDHALDKPVTTPFGEMPLRAFLEIFVTDVVAHTWDLGRATGQDVRLDAQLVDHCHQQLQPLEDALRGPGMFDPPVPVGADADDQARFLAFLGRDPG